MARLSRRRFLRAPGPSAPGQLGGDRTDGHPANRRPKAALPMRRRSRAVASAGNAGNVDVLVMGKAVGLNRSSLTARLESWLLVRRHVARHGFNRAMELAVGGNDDVGDQEVAVLDHFGFRDGN